MTRDQILEALDATLQGDKFAHSFIRDVYKIIAKHTGKVPVRYVDVVAYRAKHNHAEDMRVLKRARAGEPTKPEYLTIDEAVRAAFDAVDQVSRETPRTQIKGFREASTEAAHQEIAERLHTEETFNSQE